MPQAQPRYLVVGADSMVGGALIARLRKTGARVLGTTRRRETLNEECLYLDLAQDVQQWRPPQPVEVAILCAGVTALQACKDHPAESARVNVEGVSQLARRLLRDGTFVIYLSTNQVFDGSLPFRPAHDPPCPVTEYGRQKAEAERQLRESRAAAAVVRFTKILGPRTLLFLAWAEALRRGHSIQPYSDMTLAPVPLSTAVSVLLLLASERLAGTFQVSGDQDISYAAAAQMGAQALGANPQLVQPVNAAQAKPGIEPMPLHTTLDTNALKATLGIIPPDAPWTVKTAFVKPGLLGGA